MHKGQQMGNGSTTSAGSASHLPRLRGGQAHVLWTGCGQLDARHCALSLEMQWHDSIGQRSQNESAGWCSTSFGSGPPGCCRVQFASIEATIGRAWNGFHGVWLELLYVGALLSCSRVLLVLLVELLIVMPWFGDHDELVIWAAPAAHLSWFGAADSTVLLLARQQSWLGGWVTDAAMQLLAGSK